MQRAAGWLAAARAGDAPSPSKKIRFGGLAAAAKLAAQAAANCTSKTEGRIFRAVPPSEAVHHAYRGQCMHEVTNWALKYLALFWKNQNRYICLFFRPKPTVLGVLAGSAGQ
jgi:hypothetical protein